MLPQLISLAALPRIAVSQSVCPRWVVVRVLQVLFALVLSLAWVSAHAQFGPGCAPPSVPNFANGNQIVVNAAIPGGLNFGFASRPASCTAYNGIRVKVATSLPPGITAALGPTATSVGFTGTPTALGNYTAIIEVTPDGGTTWADALRIVFDVASCMNWNGSSNQRFPISFPASSVNGNGHVALPRPSAGMAYSASATLLANPPGQYAPNLYCSAASFQLSNFGGGSMTAASGPNPPLGFTVSGTPASDPNPNPDGCLTNPDAGADASIRVFNASNEQIGGLPVCFSQNNNPGPVTLGAVLPIGTVGVPYNGTFNSNAMPPAIYAVVDGFLPPGLTLNAATGAVTGTPTTAGVRLFVARVTGSDTLSTTGEFSITINAAPTQGPNATTVPTLGTAALSILALLLGASAVAFQRSARRTRSNEPSAFSTSRRTD